MEGQPEVLTYPISPEILPTEEIVDGRYALRFARNDEELNALLRLRFEVFNLEMNEGLEGSFETQLDRDDFDAVCHHLIVVNTQDG
ncbi:MAG: GNAT family N-acetyltransferase, partial [Thermoanaerobaculia bacterium]|nr:GNAT family N-acetyltransferase [Thermoanaerobaculia bacterium]